MKYREPQILLEVRKIKEQLHRKRELEGADAFFERLDKRAEKRATKAKSKLSKKSR